MTVIIRGLKQPAIVGYIVTGILVGPMFLNIVKANDAIESFGKIGVVLLLFIVGLGLKPSLIREVGKISIITGLSQIIVTSIIGYPLARWLGFNQLTSIYLAIAFTFSSTIIILQLLYTKEEQDTLYGRIATGLLLVQDLFAMIVFLFLTSIRESGGNISATISIVIIKIIAIAIIGYVINRLMVPRVDTYFVRHREILFIFSLVACFGVAALFSAMEFSLEIGALTAGILLSTSPYHREIATRLGGLRDFFLLMFFIVLGAQVSASSLVGSLPAIIYFSLFIIIGNPLIVLVLLKLFGYTSETGFLTGLTVSQISEFSLILLANGVAVGHLDPSLLGPATIIGLITIFVSSYFIMHNHGLYQRFKKPLGLVFGKDFKHDGGVSEKQSFDVILFGCHRLGGGVEATLRELNWRYLVIDHNPDIVLKLTKEGVNASFGSASDMGYLESLPIKTATTIISTIPETDINLVLVEYIKRVNSNATILCISNHQHHATRLYEAGATYVIVPPYLGRKYLVKLLREYKLNSEGYMRERKIHEAEIRLFQDANI